MDLEEVISLAARLHGNQLDKSGRPYLSHPERVAGMVRRSGGTWAQEQAAWLHDTIEDTGWSGSQLLAVGVAGVVVDTVDALTHRTVETNEQYWDRVRNHPAARLVKLCDIYDNLSPERLCYLDESTQYRLRTKYARALAVLA